MLRTSSPPCWRMNLPYDIQGHRSTEVRYDCTPKTYHLNTEPQEVWLDVWGLVLQISAEHPGLLGRVLGSVVFGSLGEVIVFMVLQCLHMTSFDRGDVLLVASTTHVRKILWQPVWQQKSQCLGGVYIYIIIYIWVFPKIGVPQNGWFMVENPIKLDDLGVPLFLETPVYKYLFLIYPHPSKSPRKDDMKPILGRESDSINICL